MDSGAQKPGSFHASCGAFPDLQGLGGLLWVEENQNGIAGPAGDSEASSLLSVVSYINLVICTSLVCEGTRRLDEQCPPTPLFCIKWEVRQKGQGKKQTNSILVSNTEADPGQGSESVGQPSGLYLSE